MKFHLPRLQYVLTRVKALVPNRDVEVLDIGRSYLSLALGSYYNNVTTLGFTLHAEKLRPVAGLPAGPIAGNIDFDLNDCQSVDAIPTDRRFDLIVFCEVIEHLYTAPELVLNRIGKLLKPGAYMIVQTPNAAFLGHRLKLLVGRNPFERIRVQRTDPGHFREYTKRELIEIGSAAGLSAVEHVFANYFGPYGSVGRKIRMRVIDIVTGPIPSLRRGQTIIYRAPE